MTALAEVTETVNSNTVLSESNETAESNEIMKSVSDTAQTYSGPVIVTPGNLLLNPDTTMVDGSFPDWTMKYTNSELGGIIVEKLTSKSPTDGYYVLGDKVWIKDYKATNNNGFMVTSQYGKNSAASLEQNIPVKKGQTYTASFNAEETDNATGHVVYSFGPKSQPGTSKLLTKSDGKVTVKASYTAKEDGIAVLYVKAYNENSGFLGTYLSRLRLTNLKVINADVTPPVKPSVSTVVDTTTKVLQGTGEADTTIIVSDKDGNELGRTTTDAYGAYSLDIPRQIAGNSLFVTNQDYAGNISEGTEVVVKQGPLDKPTINEVTNSSTEVTGTADKGSFVTVTVNKLNGTKEPFTGEVDMEGNYSVPINTPVFGESVSVQTNLGGFKSETETTPVVDVLVPDAPQVNTVSNEDEVVTGTADKGNTITVILSNGEQLTTTVDDKGQFSVAIPLQNIGEKIQVTQTKPSGLVSPVNEVTVLKTGISAPEVDELSDKSTFVSGKGEPFSDVDVVLNFKNGETATYEGATNSQGKFSIPVPMLSNVVSVDVTLSQGELISRTVNTLVKDTTPPEIPVVGDIAKEDTKITGTAEANAIVVATVDGVEIGRATADNLGNFTITITKQPVDTKISVIAIDAAGNKSVATEVIVGNVYLKSPLVDEVTNVSTVITGTTEANADVYIEAKTAEGSIIKKYEGKADSTGRFSFLTPTLNETDYIEVTASKDGLTSRPVKKTVKDVIAPNRPKVDPVNEFSTKLTGIAEAGSTVSATVDGTEIGRAIVDDKGNFTIEIEKQELGSVISIVATDVSGNVSEPATTTVGTTSGTITLDSYKVGSTFVTGTYTGDVRQAQLIINNKLISWGGEFNNGKFTYYVGPSTLKTSGQTIKLTGIDANGSVLDTKDLSVVNDAAGEVSEAKYTIGETQITGTYTGDVKKARLKVNGKVISWGGSFVNGTFTYYTGSGLIKAGDVVTLDAYDKYEDSLQKNVNVDVSNASATVEEASYVLGTNEIKGTYTGGTARKAKLSINGKTYSWGGAFVNGKFSYYINASAIKNGDIVTLDLYDTYDNKLTSTSYNVPVKVGTGKITEAKYILGDNKITGKYEGAIKRAQVKINGVPLVIGGTFAADGTFSYYVGTNKINAESIVTLDAFDIEYNYLQKDNVVMVETAE
ncbi:Ig-like domain-containing protein [Enterococcus faecalis]|uniref:Ig-like domain-containing protein n=1 Tax=Enterococcus faecalis TaxID=1351 RepID=UPI0025AF16C9|nr:Ig-like domain-containing protein [Enterococcus faecalis]MDN3185229.1 Ig-like domain-containing protein [Enterococcus faecalis]